MIQCTAPSDWLSAEATVYRATSEPLICWLHGGSEEWAILEWSAAFCEGKALHACQQQLRPIP